ncbi:MAG TPA: F0F1 ATP synthase subunit gamma [Candidatus Saccharimonadales bacterium]|nr:F0F1 ATP synthase subunit gamma [Candidatus Saccharimonadales bacterium]
MISPREIARQETSMTTLAELTSAFEGIASMRIAQIKSQVQQSTKFFNELWHIYEQLRVSEDFSFGREEAGQVIDKELYIIITAEGGFSGDIDLKLVELVLQTYDKDKNDIVVVGHHGAVQLTQRGIAYKRYFRLPAKDQNINVVPLVRLIQQYRTTTAFYQEYVSLMSQEVRRMELSTAVHQRGKAAAGASGDIISEQNYIFEPSTYAVAAHLERSMMQIAVGQLILDSKLAQYASRFRAMSVSHDRADESKNELHLSYNQARRTIKDERLKEIISGLKKSRVRGIA